MCLKMYDNLHRAETITKVIRGQRVELSSDKLYIHFNMWFPPACETSIWMWIIVEVIQYEIKVSMYDKCVATT